MQRIAPSPAELAADLFAFMSCSGAQSQGEVLNVVLDLDLTIPQLRILFALQRADRELALHEIAEDTGLSLAGASRTVDALARSGLVSRREDVHDRRVKRIGATTAGRTAIDRLAAARLAGLQEFAETMTDEERAAISHAIAPVLARIAPDHAVAPTEEPAP